MKNNSIKNLFIAGLTLLSFGFLSAQFVIPSGIDNALQIIQRVLVTTAGTSTGNVVIDINTGNNNIFINPELLPTITPYSGSYVLTLNNSGFIGLTDIKYFIEHNNFSTSGNRSFFNDTDFYSGVTFHSGPILFDDTYTIFSGGTIDNYNNTLHYYSGASSIYHTGSSIIYQNGSTIIFQSGTIFTGDGLQAIQGSDGVDGIDGTDGQNGTDGIGIDDAFLSGSDLIVQLSDGSAINVGSTVGPQGIQGLPGIDGVDGTDGVGVDDAFLSGSDLIIQLSDGSAVNVGSTVGSSDIQTLTINDTQLSISSGNTIDLGSSFWSLLGNSIDDTINKLGTLNNQILRIITNNLERMTILGSNGYVGVNNNNPQKRLHVNGAIASSIMKVSTDGLSIPANHNDRFGLNWNIFINQDRSGYFSPDNKVFFIPEPLGLANSILGNGFTIYILFIDVEDVNTVILEPKDGEIFVVGGYINGTTGQKLFVTQKDFNFTGSTGNVIPLQLSVGLPSWYIENIASGNIITNIPVNTLDHLFSTILSGRNLGVDNSYVHGTSYQPMVGGFDTTTFEPSFQSMNTIGVCSPDNGGSLLAGVFCSQGQQYVYDGEYWLRIQPMHPWGV